ncbi:MAG: class I SAM-dependent methyltransferase [Phycisphaeraceae bacterium]|nr:class I SAM-dependent methyltransferase [Phycisphaeraceae bacterium]
MAGPSVNAPAESDLLANPLTNAAAGLTDGLEADRRAFLAEWGPMWRDLAWNAPEPGTRLSWMKVVQLVAAARDVSRRGVPGGYAEFGVWRGGALCFVGAAWGEGADRQRAMLGFDSFRGLPEGVASKDGDVVRPKMFDDTSVERTRATLSRHGLAERVELVPGWFEDTVGRIDAERLALLHIDCDLYEGTRLVLERGWPRVEAGGIVIVDDYRCPDTPGVTIAVEEFFARRSERVEMGVGMGASCWVRKGL